MWDYCEQCGENPANSKHDDLCGACRRRNLQGGYLYPEYLTSKVHGMDEYAATVIEGLEKMLATYAEFTAKHGTPWLT